MVARITCVCASCCFVPTGGGGSSSAGVRVRARLAASDGGVRPGAVRIFRAYIIYIFIICLYGIIFIPAAVSTQAAGRDAAASRTRRECVRECVRVRVCECEGFA